MVRYFPLLQGASHIVDEQANWLYYREPVMRSLWEEGGFSPEEFEKTFSPKGLPNVPGKVLEGNGEGSKASEP